VLSTFSLEGFAEGNNVHQFLAIFGPLNAPGGNVSPRYALSALTEVGDGCAVDVSHAHMSYSHGDRLRVTLSTFTTSTTGWCDSPSRTYELTTNTARLEQLERK
jgi:hypothetical protein